MSGKNKIGNTGRSDHHSYLKGEMSDKERNAFERGLEADPFERDAAEGLSSISGDEMKGDLEKLSKRLDSRISKRRITTWYRLSAAAMVILIVSSVFLVRELRRPGVVLSDNQGAKAQKSEIEQITDPVKEITETSESTQPAVKNEMADPGESQIIQTGEAAAKRRAKEAVSQTATVPVKERAEEENMAEAKISDVLLTDTVADYVISEMVVEVSPLARPSAKSSSKKVDKIAKPSAESWLKNRVSGVVVSSDDNLPVPGVSITLKGTKTGVASDFSGYFEIDADSSQVLVAEFIGMKRKEIDISNSEDITITLEPDIFSLDEVIVMAYSLEGRVAGIETVSSTEISFNEEQVEYTVPLPEGGMTNLKNYIQENLVFPVNHTESDREVVRIKFTIEPGVAPYDFEVIRSPGEEFSYEAIRLIKEGPAWIPAMRNDEPVTDSVSLRIVFRKR